MRAWPRRWAPSSTGHHVRQGRHRGPAGTVRRRPGEFHPGADALSLGDGIWYPPSPARCRLEQVIRAVRDLDMDEVRGNIARREAEGPATRPDRGIRPGRQTALLRVHRRGPAKYAGSARSFSLVRAVVPNIAASAWPPGGAGTMSELAVESAPDVAAAAHDAARGQLVYITERGNRVAGSDLDRRRETPQQGARRPLTLMLVSVALRPRGHDDGTMAIGPWAWFSTACRTEPGPRRPGWLACLPMTTRSARADNPASARPG